MRIGKSVAFWLLLGGAVTPAVFVGCSSDEGGTGSGGSSASSTSASSVSSSSSAVVVSSSSTGGGTKSQLAAKCSNDADCGDDYRCIAADGNSAVLGGGAPGGYCTKDCLSDMDCPGFGSVCRKADSESTGECFLGCAIGPALQFIDDPLEDLKCRGREDLRCNSGSDADYCLPTCGDDSQCPGRVCNQATGACSDMQSPGSKVNGAICDADAPNQDDCIGFCQTFSNDSPSICTSPCVLGGNIMGKDCGGLDKGLCVYRPNGFGAGDFGRCAAACNQHSDCGNESWYCVGGSFLQFTSGNGYCFTVDSCTDNASCDTDEYCVDTKDGKKCLEYNPNDCGQGGAGGGGSTCKLLFPLGDAAPGTGGAGGN